MTSRTPAPRVTPTFWQAFHAEQANARRLRDQAHALAVHTADQGDPLTYAQDAPSRPSQSAGAPRVRRPLGFRVLRALAVGFALFVGLGMLGNAMHPRGADAGVPSPAPAPQSQQGPVTVTVPASPVTVTVVATSTVEPTLVNPTAALDDTQVIDLRTGGELPPAPAPVQPEITAMVLPAPTTQASECDRHTLDNGYTPRDCVLSLGDPGYNDAAGGLSEYDYGMSEGWGPNGQNTGGGTYFPPGDPRNDVEMS